MKKLLFLFFVFTVQLFSIEILKFSDNANIEILTPPSYFFGDFSNQEAYQKFQQSKFISFSKEIKSLGFSDKSLWIGFELVNKNKEKQFLSFIYNSLEDITLYAYKNDKLLYSKKSNFLKDSKKNDIKSVDPYFYLNNTSDKIVYLIKIKTKAPLIVNMFMGTQIEVLNYQFPKIIFFFISMGAFISIIIFSIFVYISSKEKDYLLFAIYNFFLGLAICFSYGYLTSILKFTVPIYLNTFILQLAFSSFVFFTIDVLNISKINQKLFRFSLLLILFFNSLFIFNYLNFVYNQIVNVLIIIFIILSCLYLALNSFLRKSEAVKYYLIAIGGYLIGLIVTLCMKIGLLNYSFFTVEAHFLGFIWQMIFLFLALGYKIKVFQEEKDEAVSKMKFQEKILFLQSRQASFGKLIGNITHQWKEPLSEIGAIWTNIEANMVLKGEVSKERIIKAIKQNNKIIQHLSETINVFYKSFKDQSNTVEKFNISQEIFNIEKIVYYTLKVENINFIFKYTQELEAYGNKNAFVNALLNIILNAKDILVQRKILNPYIKITLYKKNEKITIDIEDNAQGIEKNLIDKIFRAGVTTKEESNGLGLFISKTIIEQKLNGKLSVKNSQDGAVFKITLPLYLSKEKMAQEINYNIEESTLQRLSKLEKEVLRQEEIEKTLKKWENSFIKAHWAISFHKGESTTFKMVNPAFCEMYGYSNEELKQRNLLEFFDTNKINNFFEKREEAFEKSFISFESINVKKDGTKFPVNIDLTVIKDNNEVLYYIANIRDITKQKENLNRLLFQKFALDNLYEAIFLFDKNLQICYANRRAYQTLQYTKEEILTLNLEDIKENFSVKEQIEILEKVQKQKFVIVESLHRKKDNCLFPVRVKLNYFQYENEIYYMAFCMGYNINNNKNF